MSPVEIIFILLGSGILIASLFVSDGNKNQTKEEEEESLETREQEIKKYLDQRIQEKYQMMEEKAETVMEKTEDALSRVSNEKIMAVNDFSAQILEKINTNHKEVVFLYDMLNQKEDEIKKTVRQFEEEKEQLRGAVEDVIRLSKQISSIRKKPMEVKNAEGNRTTMQKEEPAKQQTQMRTLENKPNSQAETVEMLQRERQKEEVLRLHKEGKSVLDISKQMDMGQGEVKLIISLYGM